MKKLIIPFLCFILLAFVSSTGAWNTAVMVGGKTVAAAGGTEINDDFSSDNLVDECGSVLVTGGIATDNDNWAVSMASHNTELSSANHYVEVDINFAGSDSHGILLSYDRTAATGYLVYVDPGVAGLLQLYSITGCTSTYRGDFDFGAKTFSASTWYTIKAQRSGNAFSAWVDWNDDGDFGDADEASTSNTITDSTYTGGKYVGLFNIETDGTANESNWDNLVADAL